MAAPLTSLLDPCVLGGEVIQIPKSAVTQEKVFRHVFSDKTWKNVLSEEDRTRLRKYLPKGENKEQDSAVHKLFTLQNIKFGNPLKRFHKSLKRNQYDPETYYYRQLKRRSMYKAYKQKVLQQHTESLQILLLLRQNYMDDIQGLTEQDVQEKLNPKWREKSRTALNLLPSGVDDSARALYKTVVGNVRRFCGDGYQSSSDDETGGDGEGGTRSGSVDVQSMLSAHYKRRLSKQITPTLDTRGTTMEDVIDRALNDKHDSDEEMESAPAAPLPPPPPAKKPKLKPASQPEKKAKAVKAAKTEEAPVPPPTPVHSSEKKSKKAQTPTSAQIPYNIGNTSSLVPYQNVLGLLKAIMTASSSSLTAEMSESEICAEINRWQETEVAKLCPWASIIHDWTPHIKDILHFLSDQADSPLLTATAAGYWRWCSDGNDSKQRLNAEWAAVLENISSLALIMGEIKGLKPEDERPESQHGETFHQQEAMRYAHPHRCFTYRLNHREYLVGPIKGVYDKVAVNSNNKAREHVLLVNDRPSYVTILTLVRDAAARLPKGEGTRYEICDLLQQSQFISESASINHINTVVSGALDRLHYEKDPCVKFDSARKNWIYLHGDRTAEELEMLHQAQGAAVKAKKASKPSKSSAAANTSGNTESEKTKAAANPPPQSAPFLSMQAETQLAEQSIMDVDNMSQLLSTPSASTPASKSHSKSNTKSTQHMRAVKVEHTGELGRALSAGSPSTRLISMQLPQSIPQKKSAHSAGHINRQLSTPVTASADSMQPTNPSWTAAEAPPTLIHSSSIPKGALVYQRIPSTQGGQSQMMQKVLTGSPGAAAAAKQLPGNSALMHRIVGNASGTPVLARLVPQKGMPPGGQQQQQQHPMTHLQLPGGDSVAIPSRAVQIVSGASPTPGRTNMLQVQNMGGVPRNTMGGVTMTVGGATRAVGGVTMSVGGVNRSMAAGKNVGAIPPASTKAPGQQVKLSNLQQQLSAGKALSTGNKASSLLAGQSDGRGGQVQLVKALITSSEGKPGSQAYILTSNSGQRGAFVTTKPSTVSSGAKSPMIARVLQPDGTLTAVKSGRVSMPAGGKSILTNVAAGMKNPLIVRQVSSQSQLPSAQGQLRSLQGQSIRLPLAKSGGEIPKKIEQSELSPSTELDVETDT